MNFDLLSVDSKLYELSQWDLLSKQLESFFKFNTNKKSLSQLPQLNIKTLQEIESHFIELSNIIKNYRELSEEVSLEFTYLSPNEETTNFLKNIEKHPYVNLTELNNLCLILEIFCKVIHHPIIKSLKNCPIVAQDTLDKIKIFIRNTRQLINTEEVLFLDRHPKLLSLNQELSTIDSQLKAKIQELHQSSKYRSLSKLDFEIIHDAYYILIPSDHYVHAMGKVHGKSSSGKSLYIEPIEFLELNSKRQVLVYEIKNIIEKIIHELIEGIIHFAVDLRSVKKFIIYLDFLFGRARFSQKFKTCSPTINNEKTTDLENMYLASIASPFPNSVRVDSNFKAILISGPNTGGKSVFLKTFASNLILISHGFEACATKANVDLSQNLYFFSHDFQDIEVRLSSFSAEVTNYLSAIKHASLGSIFLFDEIFNSTSSEEASSLSLSLFEYLLNNNFQFIATTHHSKLKYEFSKLKDTQSASFALNTYSGTPTYQITYGKPGTSQAFKIFEQIEKKIMEDSPISKILPQYVSAQEFAIENLIQEILLKEDKIEELKRNLEKERSALHLRQNRLEEEAIELKIQLNEDFKKHILQTEVKLYKLIKEIEAKEITKKQALNELIRVEKKYLHITNDSSKIVHLNDTNFDFQLGQQVRHLPSNIVGIITQIDNPKSKITFTAKGKTLTTKRTELEPTAPKKIEENETKINLDLELPTSTVYDCRGLRAQQVERDLYRLIYHIANGDIPYLIVIHGHGEGILKKLIREILELNSDLKWKPEDGNDGSTRVELKS